MGWTATTINYLFELAQVAPAATLPTGSPPWVHLVDIAVCTILLRIVFEALVAYRNILRFIIFALIVMGAAYVVDALELPLGFWLVAVLLLPVTLIMIVNIMPELRRLYQAASVGRIFKVQSVASDETVEEIATAVEEMARQRIGAIFVFARTDSVREHIHGGENIICNINKWVLLSILNTKSPRHDGAVVVEEGMVRRIGAVLPLAAAESSREGWGTRHLAALGLSERCDAHVIVVSEERGEVSHIQDKKVRLLKPLTSPAVEQAVSEAMGLVGSQGKRRINYVTYALWALAFVTATIGSFGVDFLQTRYRQQPLVLRSMEGKVSYANIPNGYFVDGTREKACTVYVRMPPGATTQDIKLEVTFDLAKHPPGPVTINLSREMVKNLPKDWEVDRFEPPQFNFILAQSRQLKVAIDPVVSPLPPSLKLVSAVPTPDTLDVEVRDDQWLPGARLSTQPIDTSGIRSPGVYTLRATVLIPPALTVPSVKSGDRLNVPVRITVGPADSITPPSPTFSPPADSLRPSNSPPPSHPSPAPTAPSDQPAATQPPAGDSSSAPSTGSELAPLP
ncbi:MAG: diadenylate cyclase [Candidatus Methylacidiphilales bacterium]|nr:DNA integrity scanning protein DisA nucleotide-binding domain protein [Candidatus Methylacidiphilales bacterium]